MLKEKKDAEDKAKAERGNRRGGNNDRRGGRRNDRNASESRPHSHRTNASNNVAAGMDFPNPDKQGKGKKRKLSDQERAAEIAKLEKEMREASKMLEFEYAAVLRDRIIELRGEK